MRLRFMTLLLSVPLLLCSTAYGQTSRIIQSTPRITGVTVYPDRAMTIRAASFELKPGKWILALEPLPVLMQDDSIRVEGTGTAAAVILGTEVSRRFVDQSPEQRVREIDEDIKSVERSIGSIDSRKSALAAQRGFIESIRVAWGDRISKELAVGKPTSGELDEALQFVGKGITTVEEKNRDLEIEKRKLKERLEALRNQRDQVIGSGRKEVKRVEIEVEVTREGTLDMLLSGVLPQAGWEPSYDVRLASDGNSAELVFRGDVHQQTGEEWTGVELALSTARPALGGTPPGLEPWKVRFHEPRPVADGATVLYGRPYAKGAQLDRQAEPMMAEEYALASAPHQTAEVAREQSAVLFKIARTTDIPPDGAQHGTVVAIEKFPVRLELTATPKISPHVFLKSELENRAAYPLLAGSVNIFNGPNFIGNSRLKRIAPGEKFDIHFGADDEVTVKREELKSHKEAGIFGKNRMSYRYRIELNNFRKEPRTVFLRDQMPVPENDEIKVTLDDPSVKPEEVRQDGTITWKLQLNPGEKRDLTFGVTVEYPKEKEIIGL